MAVHLAASFCSDSNQVMGKVDPERFYMQKLDAKRDNKIKWPLEAVSKKIKTYLKVLSRSSGTILESKAQFVSRQGFVFTSIR